MSSGIELGCSLEKMKSMADASVDSVVTDPPYGLEFMGKGWDKGVPGVEFFVEMLRVLKPGGHLLSFGGSRTYHRMACAVEDAGFEIRDQIMWIYGTGFPKSKNLDGDWQGWGTALKPAHEPIVMARKPLIGTVAKNVAEFGCGAINVDGCRVEGVKGAPASPRRAVQGEAFGDLSKDPGTGSGWNPNVGRHPTNVIHDGSDEVISCFPQSKDSPHKFFYCAKASKKEKGSDNSHPTVKPLTLMRYLCRLVTPPGGLILDPFAGSGTTGVAAKAEGFRFIGFEKDPGYFEIATRRLA